MNQEDLNALMRNPWEAAKKPRPQPLPECPQCGERYCGDGIAFCTECANTVTPNMLVWTCDEDESPEMQNGAEPWEQCGGDAILETADIGDFHDSGGDAYQDKFGENVITQWVQWNISDEDE